MFSWLPKLFFMGLITSSAIALAFGKPILAALGGAALASVLDLWRGGFSFGTSDFRADIVILIGLGYLAALVGAMPGTWVGLSTRRLIKR
jgi:hypothetical protein